MRPLDVPRPPVLEQYRISDDRRLAKQHDDLVAQGAASAIVPPLDRIAHPVAEQHQLSARAASAVAV
jgi:hypothetical protein